MEGWLSASQCSPDGDNIMLVLSVIVSSRSDAIACLTCSDHTLRGFIPGFFCSGVDFRKTISGDWHECVECRRISLKSAHVTHVQRLVYVACQPGSDIRGFQDVSEDFKTSSLDWSNQNFLISINTATAPCIL